ncbi:LOW QUALITY PROTEIN: hypothetical protein ACHAW6_008617 [Cyclotella cf. meneghiniana]
MLNLKFYLQQQRVSGVHHLSSYLRRVDIHKQYLLPIITDILHKCSGNKFVMKLDISMQYNIPLNLMNIVRISALSSLLSKNYLRLPMGLKCSPVIAHSIMESVLAGIDDADVYIDDVGASPKLGITISIYLMTYYAALLSNLNVNGPSKKLTGWDVGLLHGV